MGFAKQGHVFLSGLHVPQISWVNRVKLPNLVWVVHKALPTLFSVSLKIF